MKYYGGLYMRQSREDGRSESAGIEGQRLLLYEYARQRGFEISEEYVDDGYSGTADNRPAFRKMLSDIEAGKINLVLTKDLSRLGRNYLLSGEMTEVYFPAHHVRFIAINDGYDSECGGDDMAPFRHVMNEMYARDISRKIRSSLYAKMREGQYIGSYAPYGYRKDPQNKNHLIPDFPSAKIVCWIFEMAVEGKTTSEIVEKLNENTVPIPSDYRKTRRGEASLGRKWTPSGVCKILANSTYLGHTVQGKSQKPSFRFGKTVPRKKEEWIVVKNTHEPLVSEELFRLAAHRPKR